MRTKHFQLMKELQKIRANLGKAGKIQIKTGSVMKQTHPNFPNISVKWTNLLKFGFFVQFLVPIFGPKGKKGTKWGKKWVLGKIAKIWATVIKCKNISSHTSPPTTHSSAIFFFVPFHCWLIRCGCLSASPGNSNAQKIIVGRSWYFEAF